MTRTSARRNTCQDIHVFNSQPWGDAPTDNGWKVSIVTAVLGDVGDDTSLTVYAICGALVEPP